MKPDQNDKGEYLLWDKGREIGYAAVDYVDGVMVVKSMAPKILQLKAEAKREGIELTLAAGLRTFGKQAELRRRNVIDKTKAFDEDFILHADSALFNPATAKPGYSNHHDGMAYDFNITGHPQTYRWLVNNAHRFGFIRAVSSERWHWEYRPKMDRFAIVKRNHSTWDGLV